MNEDNISSAECTEVLSAQEPIIQLTEHGVEGFDMLCRLCANRAEHLISIYSEEGVTNDLAEKMNLYLPIKVNKTDVLPLQCCFQCASTVLTWHELVIASVEADRRLREIQLEVEKQLVQQNSEPGPSQTEEEKSLESEDDRCTAPIKILIKSEPIIRNDILDQNKKNDSLQITNLKKHKRKVIKINNNPKNTIRSSEVGTSAVCESELKNNDLNVEIKPHILPRKTFQCAECGKHFFQKLSLVRHIRIHRDERPYTCHICGKGFRDVSGLKRHIRDVHAQTKNFTCDICSTSFASKATRDDHRRSHTKERPFICTVCSKCFSRKASLYMHSKTHTDVFPFSCSVCNRKFRRRQELVAHSSTHSGEKPYQCIECGKFFRIKNLLMTHRLIHTDHKPYICNICGIAYRQARYLKNHMNSKHSNQECSDTVT